ncbi:MAG: hypothetical protein ACOC5F_00130 [Candidatus Aminicenantaceae bacterium]
MILNNQKRIKKASVALLVLIVFISLNANPLIGGSCEKAYSKCMDRGTKSADSFWNKVYNFIVYAVNFENCTEGYLFCLKYLAK